MKYISAILALSLLAVAGCSQAEDSASNTTTLNVYAAASLTEVFEDVATAFNKEQPDIEVKYSFAGSADLVSQITEGAPADVIATADEKTMKTLANDDLLTEKPQLFASNTLALAVAEGNPKRITGSKDLAGVDLVTCAPQVPCGAATKKWSDKAGVAIKPVSEENSVTDVLGKVTSGQADAGIVYVTDIRRGGEEAEQVDLDGAEDVVNLYPAAAVKASKNQEAAKSYVDFLRSDEAGKLLQDAGFATP